MTVASTHYILFVKQCCLLYGPHTRVTKEGTMQNKYHNNKACFLEFRTKTVKTNPMPCLSVCLTVGKCVCHSYFDVNTSVRSNITCSSRKNIPKKVTFQIVTFKLKILHSKFEAYWHQFVGQDNVFAKISTEPSSALFNLFSWYTDLFECSFKSSPQNIRFRSVLNAKYDFISWTYCE